MQAFRDISSWCDQHSLSKTISDIAKQSYKLSDGEKSCYGARILTRLLRLASLSRVARPMSREHSQRFAILRMSGAVGKVPADKEMVIKLQVCS